MLTNNDVQVLSNLENKLYYTIMDNLFENGIEVAKTEYEKFISKLEIEGYNQWVINCIVNKNKQVISMLG